jgi:hypothetical protein
MVVLAGREEMGAQPVLVEMAPTAAPVATALPALAPILAREEMVAWVAMLDQGALAATAERAGTAATVGKLT